MPPLPSGVILIWSGAIVDIPAGYILCNGAGGSPDLRNRFIVGAGDTYDPADTGGALTHAHDFTSDGHSHGPAGPPAIQAGSDQPQNSTTDTDSGTTDPASSLPPYYALAYIMKT